MVFRPEVSVIVANYNGSCFIRPLFEGLLRQYLSSIEIIVIDDASTDDSVSILNAFSQADPRVRVKALEKNTGPAGARNAGLDLAKGKWIAVVDSDDLVHPRRLERLVAAGNLHNADIVADDLLIFYDDERPRHRFLKGRRARRAGEVDFRDYIQENAVLTSRPALGFLKPLFLRESLEKHGIRYNETLRIGEDYDFVLQGLAEGLKFWVEPEPYYLYRKHSQSVSSTLKNTDIARMIEGDRAFIQNQLAKGTDLRAAFRPRQRSLERARAWNDLVSALKARDLLAAGQLVLKRPSLLPLLTWPVRAHIRRAFSHKAPGAKGGKKSVCFISRQRLVSGVSGSSRYVLSLAAALQAAGHEVHLIQPSPTVFGRLPILLRKPESRVFKSMRVRGGLVLGPLLIAKDPRIFGALFRGALVRLARKAGLSIDDKPAPYSVAAPWEAEDYLFTARHAASLSDAVVFDYAFQTVAAPYVLRPGSKSFVLMHDLISSRSEQFARLGGQDSLPAIDEAEEMRLLTGADVVIAIQDEEAAFVQRRTGHEVLCVPLALPPARHPHVGRGDRVLFVGTKTPPNVVGLNWFLAEVWPIITAAVPAVRLDVAGSVNRMIERVPGNVRMLGVVPNLTRLYEEAGVVISPLLAGSGLKIKLIEALAHGKAIVSTSPTLQGVRSTAGSAVFAADEPKAFAAAVIHLLTDDKLRARQAASALDVANRHFSPDACYRGFINAIAASLETLI